MEWIKIEHSMPDKPEVSVMAEVLGIDHDAVVGKLARFWIWADIQALDGNAISVTEALLDRITVCPGFTKALLIAGWLKQIEGGYRIPNFERHNGKSSKKRAVTRERVKKFRNAVSVTEALLEGEGEGEGEGESKDVPTCPSKPLPERYQPVVTNDDETLPPEVEVEKSTDKPKIHMSANADVQAVASHYSQKINSGSRLTDSAKARIKTRLKSYSVADLMQAIDKFAADKWWMENNSHRGLAWFFHSDDRIDQFLNLKDEKKDHPPEAVRRGKTRGGREYWISKEGFEWWKKMERWEGQGFHQQAEDDHAARAQAH